MVLDGLRSLLENRTDLKVVGAATSGREAVRLALELDPDLVIMDIAMPDLNGIDAATQIKKARPHIKVVALSVHDNLRYVAEAVRAGASGYLLKQCAFEEMALCLNLVGEGHFYLSPIIAHDLVRECLVNLPRAQDSAFNLLSGREREVLQLLAEGKSAKQISEILHLSVKTVESHRQNIMRKTGVRNLADLVKFAIREGLTNL